MIESIAFDKSAKIKKNYTYVKEINGNFTLREIEFAVNKLRNNKSVGIDEIPGEVLKNKNKNIYPVLLTLFKK